MPDGTFSVSASRTGYASLQYGQRRPFQPGTTVAVTAAQTVDRIDIALPRGAVIVVRVADDLGAPIAGVRVSAQRYRYADDGQRTLVGVPGQGSSFTDDRGELRLFGLLPGEYVVSAEILMPAEEALHTAVLARRIRLVRPVPDGAFATHGLRPGRYVAIAVDVIEEGRQFSPEFQQQVRRRGDEFALREGETRTLSLRTVPDI